MTTRITLEGVAFFFKQARQNGRMVSLPLLDGKRWAEFPEAWRQDD